MTFQHRHCKKILLTSVLLSGLCLPFYATAQADPSAQQIIEQLQQPKTRSLRNLIVESNGAPPSAPSVSLLIQFDFDSSRIREVSATALSNLAQALQSSELANSKFRVEGHTDAKGAVQHNLKLSQLRANAVSDYLVNQGVDARRLEATGKGSTDLARPDAPHAAENRRVRIVNID